MKAKALANKILKVGKPGIEVGILPAFRAEADLPAELKALGLGFSSPLCLRIAFRSRSRGCCVSSWFRERS
jgi:hypothetical protein